MARISVAAGVVIRHESILEVPDEAVLAALVMLVAAGFCRQTQTLRRRKNNGPKVDPKPDRATTQLEYTTEVAIARDSFHRLEGIGHRTWRNRADALDAGFVGGCPQQVRQAVDNQNKAGLRRRTPTAHKLEAIFYSPDGSASSFAIPHS